MPTNQQHKAFQSPIMALFLSQALTTCASSHPCSCAPCLPLHSSVQRSFLLLLWMVCLKRPAAAVAVLSDWCHCCPAAVGPGLQCFRRFRLILQSLWCQNLQNEAKPWTRI